MKSENETPDAWTTFRCIMQMMWVFIKGKYAWKTNETRGWNVWRLSRREVINEKETEEPNLTKYDERKISAAGMDNSTSLGNELGDFGIEKMILWMIFVRLAILTNLSRSILLV